MADFGQVSSPELLDLIFHFCGSRTLEAICYVCKTWRAAVLSYHRRHALAPLGWRGSSGSIKNLLTALETYPLIPAGVIIHTSRKLSALALHSVQVLLPDMSFLAIITLDDYEEDAVFGPDLCELAALIVPKSPNHHFNLFQPPEAAQGKSVKPLVKRLLAGSACKSPVQGLILFASASGRTAVGKEFVQETGGRAPVFGGFCSQIHLRTQGMLHRVPALGIIVSGAIHMEVGECPADTAMSTVSFSPHALAALAVVCCNRQDVHDHTHLRPARVLPVLGFYGLGELDSRGRTVGDCAVWAVFSSVPAAPGEGASKVASEGALPAGGGGAGAQPCAQ
eukprot:m.257894 g.257894  ORF g.257894 m.257894 type:complete len:337 (-) comp21143_c0_seq1:145-1155(-)